MSIRFSAFVLLLVAAASVSSVVLAGSPVYVGKRSVGSVSFDRIDHAAWNQLLQRYVDRNGLVDYKSWKANASSERALDQYLALLSTANPKAAAKREAKLAYWINAYNAVTVRGILREYPTSSIRNHTAKIYGYNIWHDLKLYVANEAVSLDHIEHKILRKMGEPRIHFAIVCASIGCPRLLNEAYVSDRLEEQLEANANDFFSRRQNFRHDVGSNRFYMSAILNWFGSDFGCDQKSQLRAIAKWLPSKPAKSAAAGGKVRVSYLSYDWDLNEQ